MVILVMIINIYQSLLTLQLTTFLLLLCNKVIVIKHKILLVIYDIFYSWWGKKIIFKLFDNILYNYLTTMLLLWPLFLLMIPNCYCHFVNKV